MPEPVKRYLSSIAFEASLDRCDEVVVSEWLGEIVCSARIDGRLLDLSPARSRDNDDGNIDGFRGGSHALDQRNRMNVQVGEDEVDSAALEEVPAIFYSSGRKVAVARDMEHLLRELAIAWIVFDDEYCRSGEFGFGVICMRIGMAGRVCGHGCLPSRHTGDAARTMIPHAANAHGGLAERHASPPLPEQCILQPWVALYVGVLLWSSLPLLMLDSWPRSLPRLLDGIAPSSTPTMLSRAAHLGDTVEFCPNGGQNS